MENKKKSTTLLRLIKQNISLNKISRITGKSKSTIYYHYRKYHGKRLNPPLIKKDNTEIVGEFMGVIAGDGYANYDKGGHYRVRIFLNINEEDYANKLIKVFGNFLGKPVHKYIHTKGNCIHLSLISKDVFDFINDYIFWEKKGHRSKSRSVCLKKIIDNDSFKKGFLRGCIDTDGYIDKKSIIFSTASKNLSKDIINFLENFDIEFTRNVYIDKRPNKSPMYSIRIRNNHRNLFLKEISPRNIKVRPGG